MNNIIIVKPEKCVGCNACVRTCPAPEANITKMLEDGRFVTTVNPDKCIACGECVRNCSHGARDYIDDTEACMARIERDKVIILAAPAIKAVFPKQWKGILDWFRRKGCLIYDVSLGADICTWAHLRALESKRVGNIISQPCAAIVNYVEIYQPSLIKYLAPIQSPIGCSATYIKKYMRRTNPIAVLSPCIAKKEEFMETGLVDYSVTFNKLMEYFEKNDIKISSLQDSGFEYQFDDQQGQLGSMYPRPGGLRDNIWQHNPDINITNSEGVHKVYPELDMYAKLPEYKHPEVFDVLSCEFGCNIGPGSGTKQSVFDVMATMREVEKSARKKMKNKGFFRGGEDKLYKQFDEQLEFNDFLRSYRPSKPSHIPTDNELEPIFDSLGKHTDAERHFDCHACGYKSCHEMAVAIYRGLNTPNNCIIHAKSELLAKHSEMSAQYEKLADITEKCCDLSEKLKHDIDEIVGNMNTIGDSTNKTSERAKVVNNLLKNVVAFCNNNPTMDANVVKQLIQILETTIKAFSVLDDNVSITNSSSEVINKDIKEIMQHIDDINMILRESEKI